MNARNMNSRPMASRCSKRSHTRCAPRRQRGFSLITALLMMVAVLLLSVAVMGVNVMQERIIGNSKDRDHALQAAEAALRDAENDVSANLTQGSSFNSTCVAGLCVPPSQSATPDPKPVHEQSWFAWTDATKVRRIGQYTNAAAVADVSSQPVYIVEKLGTLGSPSGESIVLGAEPSAPGQAYRITVRALGARSETEVILQSIYAQR